MTTLRRAGALLVSASLAVTGVAVLASPAAAVVDDRPQQIAADWLAGELTNGLIRNPNFGGFDDYGLTIDTAFALDAEGTHGSTLDAIEAALAPKVANGYAVNDEFASTPPFDFVQKGYYAGPLGKALVFAESAGIADPAAWSGTDLVAALQGRVTSAGASQGRIVDDSSYGDFANVIGQAFAAHALDAYANGSDEADDSLAFLLKQQCAAGYFRLYFTADKSAEDQTCEGGRAAGDSPADPDATSTALRMLIPMQDDPTVARAIGKAEAWLLSRQRSDGSFLGGTSTNVPNTNSTGLAGWALGLLGNSDAAELAAVWVRAQQADEVATCVNGLNTETGAIGYDPGAVDLAAFGIVGGDVSVGAGITDQRSDQWRRATAQGSPVLQWAPAATPDLELTGPTGYVRANRATKLTVTGAVPGEKLCLRGTGPIRATADANGHAVFSPFIPGGTLSRTMTVRNRTAQADQTVVKALGAKTFPVALSKLRPVRGTLVKVRATGLAPGEKVRLVFRGVTLRTAVANANGVYAAEFNVRRTLGKGTVVVAGQFAGRRGSATLTVVR